MLKLFACGLYVAVKALSLIFTHPLPLFASAASREMRISVFAWFIASILLRSLIRISWVVYLLVYLDYNAHNRLSTYYNRTYRTYPICIQDHHSKDASTNQIHKQYTLLTNNRNYIISVYFCLFSCIKP